MARFGMRRRGRSILINLDAKEPFSSAITTRPAMDKSRSNHVCQSPPVRVSKVQLLRTGILDGNSHPHRSHKRPEGNHTWIAWIQDEAGTKFSGITTAEPRGKCTFRFGESVWVPTMDTPFPGLKLLGIVKATRELWFLETVKAAIVACILKFGWCSIPHIVETSSTLQSKIPIRFCLQKLREPCLLKPECSVPNRVIWSWRCIHKFDESLRCIKLCRRAH
jgi:hypothetical protein